MGTFAEKCYSQIYLLNELELDKFFSSSSSAKISEFFEFEFEFAALITSHTFSPQCNYIATYYIVSNIIVAIFQKGQTDRKAVRDKLSKQGCFFHFSQCLFRSIQSNGLQQLYESDAAFALKMRMIAAIAFVLVADVVTSFEHLIDNTDFPEEAQSVLDYFEDTWIGRPNRPLIRRPPCFDHVLWNCFDAAKFCASKTNNACEGWHRSFSELIGASHPTIWKFLEILKGEQARNEAIMEQYTAGAEPPRKKKV